MMINRRLIGTVKETKKYIAGNVLLQWCSLLANTVMIFSIVRLFAALYSGDADAGSFGRLCAAVLCAAAVRFLCTTGAARMSYAASNAVKRTLRKKIYEKLLQFGASYKEYVGTSEAVQVCVEGVDQLETYFGSYLPQFFYSMLAPLTLFVVLSFVNMPSALVLLVCVPLIPVSIAAVQTFAKKLLAKYWGQYTTLGDTFLENLQGLTTLKIYQADAYKHQEMNRESENFRRITMRVLTMQLNSITIMDLIAYGGAALGMIMAVTQFQKGSVSLAGCLAVILLSADFFIPMRQLGSFFHIAMNGMAASDKMFRILDMPVRENHAGKPESFGLTLRQVDFSYEEEREILKAVSLDIPEGGFVALAGESGCGKSTVAALLMGRNREYKGSVRIGGMEQRELGEEALMENVTYVSHDSYLFKGTVGENLRMARPEASDQELWEVLEKTRLADFLREEQGLDTLLLEKASNLSGGQRQRLALARALLHDSPAYIFDEATSNIDVESENDIMEQICALSGKKTVLLISHRLANTVPADNIYVMEKGRVVEQGSHRQLLDRNGLYRKLWDLQQELENYGKEEQTA